MQSGLHTMEATEKLTIVPLTADRSLEWDRLCVESPDAWFWHTWANMEFNFVAAQKNEAKNLSFFVLLDGKPTGLVPLLVEQTKIGDDFSGWDAAYYGGPLPWPAFVAGLSNLKEIEDYAFQELERRARDAFAGRIRVRLSPPRPLGNEQQRLARTISTHRYLDSSYVSHSVNIQPDSLAHVRERYRRYVKKFIPQYELSIKEGAAVTQEVEDSYFHLHVKDAGGQFRSRESYSFQANLARKHEAFYVTASRRGGTGVAGMLLVSVYKGAAYDNSIAVDPDLQDEYVSHMLKWRAIETLLARGVTTYELGQKALPPTTVSIPSSKNYGISHFKEGWSGGAIKTVWMAEKFLDAGFLSAVMTARADAVKAYSAFG
jgi:Acetyltransferase (GNAT) domain